MDQNQLALLREQYQDYFIIDHQTYVNVKPFLAAAPDDAAFEQLIPEPFLMAGEMAQLERSMLKPLARLGDMAEELAFYLKAQAKKIDTMMRYILLQQDDATYRYHTLSYGGSALNYLSQTALEPGQLLEVKLFLDQSEGAVFALAAVIACEQQEEKFLQLNQTGKYWRSSACSETGGSPQYSSPSTAPAENQQSCRQCQSTRR